MKLFKYLLFIVLLIIVAGTGLYLAYNKGYLNNTPLAKIKKEDIDTIKLDAGEQTKILGDRAKETSEHIQQVLGESVKVNEEEADKALHEKAIDYGLYLYCKQVVEEFEKD